MESPQRSKKMKTLKTITPELDLVDKLSSVPNCQLLKSGFRNVIMKIYFCSCDVDQKDPICEECKEYCHVGEGHFVAENSFEIAKNMCHCGIKNHVLQTKKGKIDSITYDQKCYFQEWSSVSKLYTYFEVGAKKICFFCKNFCFKNEESIKKNDKNFHECECPHEKYQDIKNLFMSMNKLANEFNQIEFNSLSLIQIVNLVFASKKSFGNMYGSYLNYLKKFKREIQEENYEFDENIGYSTFSWFYVNLNNLTTKCKRLYYFSETAKNNFPREFVFKCNEIKFDYRKEAIWTLKMNIIMNFRKIVFLNDFSACPFFKIRDFENFNPFQRLILASNVRKIEKIMNNYINTLNFSFLDSVLGQITLKVKILKDNKTFFNQTFEIIFCLISMCKVFAKYNLFNKEQIIRFCKINDKILHKFSELRKCNPSKKDEITRPEFDIIVPMLKAVIFLVYYQNDELIQSYILGRVSKNDVVFFHSNSEISQNFIRNLINISNFIRLFYSEANHFGKQVQAKKISHLTFLLSSLSSLNPDSYLFGFRRLLERDKVEYKRYLLDNLTLEEEEIVNLFRFETNSIEESIKSYFELKIKEKQLETNLKSSLNKILDTFGLKNFKLEKYKADENPENFDENRNEDRQKIVKIYPKPIFNDNTNTEENKFQKIKTLINKSFYVFSVVKCVKILIESKKKESKNPAKNQEDKTLDLVLKLLNFLCKDNIDNCMILLTSELTSLFQTFDHLQGEKMLELYDYIFTMFRDKSIQISSSKNLLRITKKIFKLINSNENPNFFNKALKLLRITIDISVLNEESMLDKVKSIVKSIYKDNPILTSFKMLLLDSEKLDSGDKLNLSVEIKSKKKKSPKKGKKIDEEEKLLLNKQKLNDELLSIESSSTIKDKDSQPVEVGKAKKGDFFQGFEISSIFKIYFKFLNIINVLFDTSAETRESEFLSQVLDPQEIIKILDLRRSLDLKLRIELLKFFRISFMELTLDKEKPNDYWGILLNPIKVPPDSGFELEDNQVTKLISDLILVNKKNPVDIEIDYRLLRTELTNFIGITEFCEDSELVSEYFELGILSPLLIYICKFKSLAFQHNGYNFAKFFEIVYYFLEMKKHLISKEEFTIGKQVKNRKHFFKNEIKPDKQRYLMINSNFTQESLNEINQDLTEMAKDTFEILNYELVLGIWEKHFKNFVVKRKFKPLKDYFTKKKEHYNQEKTVKLQTKLVSEGLLGSEYERSIFDLILLYENQKATFNESTFVKNLGEINVQYDTNNRNLYLLFLIFLQKDKQLSLKYQKMNLLKILKILQYDTSQAQKELREIYEKNKESFGLEALIRKFIRHFKTLIFSTFNSSSSGLNLEYIISMNIIKILKFLCEEHNTFFQEVFMTKIKFKYLNDETGQESEITIFNILLILVTKIIILSNWENAHFRTNDLDISYYYDIFFVIVEFLIEMIQGTKESNFRILTNENQGEEISVFQYYLNSTKTVLLKDRNDSEIIYRVRTDIINFLMAFLEEKATPQKVLQLIHLAYNPYDICESIVNTMKKLYIKLMVKDGRSQMKVKSFNILKFDKNMLRYFEKRFYDDMDFVNYPEFELANRMFQYVKLLADEYKNEDAILMIKLKDKSEAKILEEQRDIEENKGKSQEDENDDMGISSIENYENCYMIKFFDSITKTVYVSQEGTISRVLFTVNPLTKNLSENTKIDFLEHVNRENGFTKLFGLIEYSNYFFLEIEKNQIKKNNPIDKYLFLNKWKFLYLEIYIFVFVFLANIWYLTGTYNPDNSKTNTNIDIIEVNLDDRNKALNIFETLIVVQCGIIIIAWIYSKFDLYNTIEFKKYSFKNKQDESKFKFWMKPYIAIQYSIIQRNEILTFIIHFVVGLVSLINQDFTYIFIQLYCLINLTNTLKNIVKSLTLRWKSLLIIASFLLVSVYIFGVTAFYFLNINTSYGHYNLMETVKHNGVSVEENLCHNLFYCFMTILYQGMRTDGGIGEKIYRYSFQTAPRDYMKVLFFVDTYFVVIIVVLLAVLSGVIIDTFAELREKTVKSQNDKQNVCFICNASRDELEKDSVNFESHVNGDHFVWNYAYYMIGLKFVDVQELNAINSHAFEKIEEKSISWFPSYKKKYGESKDKE